MTAILVTIPKSRLEAVEQEEADVAKRIANGEQGISYYWTLSSAPKNTPEQIWFLWNGAVRAYHDVISIEKGNPVKLYMKPEIHMLDKPIPMKGFQGWRYFDKEGVQGLEIKSSLKLGLNYSPGKAMWLAPNGQTYEGQTSDDEHAQIAYELCFKFYKKDIPKEYTPYDFITILLHHNWTRVSWFTTELYLEVEHFNMAKDAIIEYLSTQRGKSLHIEDWSGKNPQTVYKGTVDKFLDEELEKVSSLKTGKKNEMDYLKDHKVPLTEEEKDKCIKEGATWDNGDCGIWKAKKKDGSIVYGCNTHRAYQVKDSLEEAIKAFDFIKTTSSLKFSWSNPERLLEDFPPNLSLDRKHPLQDTLLNDYKTVIFDPLNTIWKVISKDGSALMASKTVPPYHLKEKGILEDNKGNLIKLEHNVAPLISLLDLEGKTLGIVTDDAIPNRTKEAQPVVLLLRKFRLYDYFSYIEVDKRINYSEYVRSDGATLFITDNNPVGKEVNDRGQVDILQRQSFEDYVELLQPKEEQRNSVLSRLGYAIVKLVKKAWEPPNIDKFTSPEEFLNRIKSYQVWKSSNENLLFLGESPKIIYNGGGVYELKPASWGGAPELDTHARFTSNMFPLTLVQYNWKNKTSSLKFSAQFDSSTWVSPDNEAVYIIEYNLPYKLISNDWRTYKESSLKLSNDTISGKDEMNKYEQHISKLSKDELEKIHKKDLGQIGGLTIWLVDAEYIRNKVDQDFSVSGEESVLVLQPNSKIVNSIKLKDLVFKEGQKVLSLDKDSISYSWESLKAITKHKTKDKLVKITTRSGRHIELSSSHSCLTVNNDGDIIKIKPSEMVKGKTVIPICGNVPSITNNIWDISSYKSVYKTKKGFKLPNLELSPDLGFLIGIYLAEGSISKEMNISSIVPEIRDRVIKYCLSIGLHKPWSNKTEIRIGNLQLTTAFLQTFGTGSNKKTIPGWVFGTPLSFRKAIIDGYWSGDGSILNNHGHIEAYAMSNSKELAEGILNLLSSIGIGAAIKKKHIKHPGFKNPIETHYYVRVATSFVKNLPVMTHKEKEVNRLLYKQPKWETSAIAPTPKNLIIGNNKNQIFFRMFAKAGRTYRGLEFVKRASKHPRLKQLLNGNIIWDVVEEITLSRKEEFIYDLSIDKNRTFVLSSGITVHNTTGGNQGRYKFVPSDEIWIEDTMSPSDIVPCIVHEFIESVLMTNEGLTYDDAHEKANKVEQKVREQISKYTGKDDILSFVKYALIDNKSLIEKEFKESSLKFSSEAPEESVKRLGIEYRGPQKDRNGNVVFEWYQDPVTNGSFAVKPGETIDQKLQELRSKFTTSSLKLGWEPKNVNSRDFIENYIRNHVDLEKASEIMDEVINGIGSVYTIDMQDKDVLNLYRNQIRYIPGDDKLDLDFDKITFDVNGEVYPGRWDDVFFDMLISLVNKKEKDA